MPRVLQLSLALPIVSTIAAADLVAKPCAGTVPVPALEEMLPRVRAALDIPGTDQVALDAAGRCIGVQVRTHGTARLVKLLLRGIDVPREAAEIRVVEVAPR
jgi:hypothetical protein